MGVHGKNRKRRRAAAVVTAAAVLLTTFSHPSLQAATHKYVAPEVKSDTDGNVTSSTWDCIWFGTYPQAEVVPASVKTNIERKRQGLPVLSEEETETGGEEDISDWFSAPVTAPVSVPFLGNDSSGNASGEASGDEGGTSQGSSEASTGASDTQAGNSQTQDTQTGSSQTQDTQAGSSQTQDTQAGSSETQDTQAGSSQTQDTQAGSSQTQDTQAGSSQTQDTQAGSSQTQDTQTGSSQTQDTQTGSSQTQDTQTGSSQTQDSQTGSSQTQDSQTGSSQTQDSQTGSSQTQDSQAVSSETEGSTEPKDYLSWLDVDKDLIADDYLYQQLLTAEGWSESNELVFNNYRYLRISPADTAESGNTDLVIDALSEVWPEAGDEYHFFRYQPVKWRVLSVNNTTKKAILVADEILNNALYTEQSDYEFAWPTLRMRSWLNGYGATANVEGTDFSNSGFYIRGFTSIQRNAILQQTHKVTGGMVRDRAYLLDWEDLVNTSYGFQMTREADNKKAARCSAYARFMGVGCNLVNGADTAGNGIWLAQDYDKDGFVFDVETDGGLSRYSAATVGDTDVFYDRITSYGARPAITLNLNSTGNYEYAGTVTIGAGSNSDAIKVSETAYSTNYAKASNDLAYVNNTIDSTDIEPYSEEEESEVPVSEPDEPESGENSQTASEKNSEKNSERASEKSSQTASEKKSSETSASEKAGSETSTSETQEIVDILTALRSPRIESDEAYENGQNTTWDTIWYGEYPQAEVVSEAISRSYRPIGKNYLRSEDLIVSDRIYNSLSSADTWDNNNDLTIGRYRYHRIKASDASASLIGGVSYRYNWENSDTYHYFRYEPIRWRVLGRNGDVVLVVSDLGLDSQPYNTRSEAVAWHESTIRSWLNGRSASSNQAYVDFSRKGFVNRAFSEKQKKAVVSTQLTDESGTKTEDQIFLLGLSQMYGTPEAQSYGFHLSGYVSDLARKSRTSLYAKAMGVASAEKVPNMAYASWWLRSTENGVNVYRINSDGTAGSAESTEGTVAVRPAMYLDLSAVSDCYYAGTVTSEGADEIVSYPEDTTSEAQIQLSNPVIQSDSSMSAGQKTTWNAVWFGSYPRSEVISNSMSRSYSAVAGQYLDNGELVVSDSLYQILENTADWDVNGDVVINGTKFRRLRQSDVTSALDSMSSHSYLWSERNEYRYFRYEPIKWRVLHVDNAQALLLADEAVDALPFNEYSTSNNWETITLRSWLNAYDAAKNSNKTSYTLDGFYKLAFTESQKSNIISTALDELDSAVLDKVFLLSTTQLMNREYGFSSYPLVRDEARRSKSSLFAKARGSAWTDLDGCEGNVYWWRRCTHSDGQQLSGSLVSVYGSAETEISYATSAMAVRPAIVIDLSVAGSCENAGTVASDGTVSEIPYSDSNSGDNTGTGTILSNPRIVPIDTEGNKRVTWDVISFGSYPQAEVITSSMSVNYDAVGQAARYGTDYVISDEIYTRLQTAVWDNYNETTILGVRYRRMRRADAVRAVEGKVDNSYFWQDDTGYHYFQYQPIRWRVLKMEDGKALLLSEYILDNQKYNVNYSLVGWENSTIRSWLNGYGTSSNQAGYDYSSRNFIDFAFNTQQKSMILTTTVDNQPNLSYSTAAGGNTTDGIFLLSEKEVYKTQDAQIYGFKAEGDVYDEARRTRGTTFSRAMGLSWSLSSGYTGNSLWSLRSPGSDQYRAACVYFAGYVSSLGMEVTNNDAGIRPAIWIDVSDMNSYSYIGTTSTSNSAAGEPDQEPGNSETSETQTTESTQTSSQTESTQKSSQTESAQKSSQTESTQKSSQTESTQKNSQTESTQTSSQTPGTQTSSQTPAAQTSSQTPSTQSYAPTKTKKVTGLVITGSSHSLITGKTMKLAAKVSPSDATNKKVTWKSSNTSYATVSSSGKVKAKKDGIGHTVTITAKAKDGRGVKGSYKIKITRDKVTSIKLAVVKKGSGYTIKATIKATGSTVNKKLKWSTSNKKYATISSSGTVKIKKAGKGHTVKITAKAADGSGKKASIKFKIK